MEEYKRCKKCNEDKNISEYYPTQKDNSGNVIRYRNICKDCYNKKSGMDNNTHIKNINSEIIINKSVRKDNFLDIFNKNDLVKTITNKENRVKVTFNLDAAAKEILAKYREQSKLNISDIVNLIIYKFDNDK